MNYFLKLEKRINISPHGPVPNESVIGYLSRSHSHISMRNLFLSSDYLSALRLTKNLKLFEGALSNAVVTLPAENDE
jgi:hypothetical protein